MSKAPPARPTPAELLSQTFDVSDDPDVSGNPITPEPEVLDTAAPKDEKANDDSDSGDGDIDTDATEEVSSDVVKDEPAPVTNEQQPIKKKLPGEIVKPNTRDYTGFSEEEVKYLKQMSNQSFEFATKALKQNKELQQQASSIYHQHPNAYVLDPAYQKLQEDTHYAETEARIWQEQLMEIKQAKQWKPLQGFDKQGNPVYGPAQPPSDLAEETVRQNMTYAAQLSQQAKGQQQMFQQQHMSRIQQDVAAMNQVQAEKFSWVADPKLTETVINIPGLGDRSIKQIKSEFSSILPTYQRNHPLADICSNMFVALQIYAAELRNANEGKKLSETKRQEALRAEPSSATRKSAPSSSTSNKRFGNWASTFDDMPDI